MCLGGAASEPGSRMGSAEWVGVGGRGMRGGRRAIALGGVLPNQKPESGPAGKQANGVSNALLRRVNREGGEVAYRACGNLWTCGLWLVARRRRPTAETEEPGGKQRTTRAKAVFSR